MTLIVQIIIYALCIFIDTIHSTEIDSIEESVCGERRNCSEGKDAQLSLDSCCRSCECEDVCIEKGTCCHDKFASNNSVNVTRQVCLPSVSYNKSHRDRRPFPSYFVRAKCPGTFQDELTRRKCEEFEPDSIEDIPFVSSKDGSVVYKNRHCAACFGELDVIPWQIWLDWSCVSNIYLDNVGNKLAVNQTYITNALLNKCSIPFIRSKQTSWKSTFCYEKDQLISTCPENNIPGSGYQDSVFKKLKEKCANDKGAYIFLRGYSSVGYSNVYCYLCNKGSGTVGTCNTDDPFKYSLQDFTFLLNIGSLTNTYEQTDDTRTSCTPYEYHDTYFNMCRFLQCPVLRFAKQGKCVPLLHQISSKVKYRFYFKLFSTGQDPQNDSEIHAFAKISMSDQLQSILQFQNCGICRMRVSSDKRNTSISAIYTSFIFITSPTCLERKILSTAATLQDDQMANKYKVIKWKQIQYKIEYIASEQSYRKLLKYSKTIYSYGSNCPYFIPSRFENCAKIYLSTKEFKDIANKNEVMKVPVTKQSNGDIKICVSDFEALTSANVAYSPITVIVLFSSALPYFHF